MNKKTVLTTTMATVTVTLDITVGSWGPGCKLEQVYSQATAEAEGKVRRLMCGEARKIHSIKVVAIATSAEKQPTEAGG